MIRAATVLLLAFAPVFAKSWTGLLVDSNCFASEERNVNKNTSSVEHDVGLEVRLCTPKPETKTFAIVLPDSEVLKLDAAGNAKAAELTRQEVHASRHGQRRRRQENHPDSLDVGGKVNHLSTTYAG